MGETKFHQFYLKVMKTYDHLDFFIKTFPVNLSILKESKWETLRKKILFFFYLPSFLERRRDQGIDTIPCIINHYNDLSKRKLSWSFINTKPIINYYKQFLFLIFLINNTLITN